MSLKSQAYNNDVSDDLPDNLLESPMDVLLSPNLLLVMLLKVTLRLPSLGSESKSAMAPLLQALLQISESGNNNSEHEGKPQAFWDNAK